MIVSHLTYHTPTLKACALTCFAWYIAVTPHLHHTLSLKQWHSATIREDLNPLVALHGLGLLPLVRKVRFLSGHDLSTFPGLMVFAFESEGLRHFHALVNVRELVIKGLDLSELSGMGDFLAHLSPEVRSITLAYFSGHPRQLRDFLDLFPKLDDIHIKGFFGPSGGSDAPDSAELAPIQGPMRGELSLGGPRTQEILPMFRGMRFVSLDFTKVQGGQFVLDACTETLEAFCFDLDDLSHSGEFFKEDGTRRTP